MEGPRPPSPNEWPHVLDFLNQNLRKDHQWPINEEYPTALTPTNINNVRIMTKDDQIVSHAVFKPLIVKSPHIIFKVGAIGSVVTDPAYRQQGISQKVLQECLRLAEAQMCDFAILWTQLFDFYRKLGFELAGYEVNSIFEENFTAPPSNLRFSKDSKISPESLFRVYCQHSVQTIRTSEEFKKYMKIPQTQIYTAWEESGQLSAFAIEGKGADLTDYIHEWGGGVKALMSLFSWIRQQKQKPITLISPHHAQNLNKELKKVCPIQHSGYLGMIKITDFNQFSAKIKRAFRNLGIADIVLEKHDGYILFGCGQDLITLEKEAELVQILLGPIKPGQIPHLKPETTAKLEKLLPLPFWLWGWDSI